MTPEEQRIAIAEACGVNPVRRWRVWYDKDRENGQIEMHSRDEAIIAAERARKDFARWGDSACISEPEEYDSWTYAPDYLNDLNAIHSAEKILTREQWSEYTANLNSSLSSGTQGICQAICHATGAQRAEAFLRTIGKWKDTK